MKTKIPGNLSALREHLAIGQAAEKSIPATEKLRLIFHRGRRCSSLPDAALIRSDNGPEFIATAIRDRLKERGIKTIYIDPGCPWQNGYVESFNDKFRREGLNRELIYTLSESRVIFADYRHLHNYERPHRSLGLLSPKAYATEIDDLGGSGRATPSLHHRGHQPKITEKTETNRLPGKLSH